MRKFGEFVCRFKKLILIVTILLMIPAAIGMANTRINYDILVYLPDNIETIQGENILTNDFQMGAYTIILVDNMPEKEMLKLEEQIKSIDSVAMCGSMADVLGEKIPNEMLPDSIREKAYKDNTTVMLVTFIEGMSADKIMEAIERIRSITDERCKVSGMAAIILDTKNIFNQEFFIYVVISVILCLVVLELALDSYVAPIFLLINIGIAILFNMGLQRTLLYSCITVICRRRS